MTSCIDFSGPISDQGYGRVYIGRGRSKRAHVVAWEAVYGKVPDGLTLDHLCRNRKCIRLDHLEPVTPRENTLRGVGPTAQNARKRACVRGHSLDGDNLRYDHRGNRACRECQREHNLAYTRRNAEVVRAKALERYYRNRDAALAKAGE